MENVTEGKWLDDSVVMPIRGAFGKHWGVTGSVVWFDPNHVSYDYVPVLERIAAQLRKDKIVPPAADEYYEAWATDQGAKPSNPKDLIGSNKVPMSLVPGTTMVYLALGHMEGDLKYGRVNWREAGVRTLIYLDALYRHVEKFKTTGEWEDPETTVPHLANALTCLSIIVDAYECGKLIDDRPKSSTTNVIDRFSEKVKFLREKFKAARPVDYLFGGPKRREG